MMPNDTRINSKALLRTLWLPVFLVMLAVYVGVTDARKEKLRGDFSEFTLRASKVMMAGYDPYNKDFVGHNYKYFPTNALLVWPLSKVSVYAAQGIWYALNLGLIIWAFKRMHLMLRPIKLPWWVTVVTLAITFRIIVMNLRLGQWNTSVFCLSLIGLSFLHTGARTGGSLLLALGITLKYMPVVFLGYLAARRRWKDLGATCAAALFWILLVPAAMLGPSRTMDLMKRFYVESTSRVDQMTKGEKVNSQSLHSAVYRKLSPVAQDNDEGVHYVNVVDLPREQAALVATAVSIVLVMVAGLWLARQHRKEPQINQVGTLLLIGFCYIIWYMAAPGVRHAQLIGMIPIIFAIAAAMAIAENRRVKQWLGGGLVVIFLLVTSPAEVIEGTTYNRLLEVYGVLPLALIVQTMVGIYAFHKVGVGSFTRSSWQVDEHTHTLVGDPKY